jgi:hypothetical protein
MLMAMGGRRQLIVLAIILMVLVLYGMFLTKMFGRRTKIIFIGLMGLIALLVLITLSPFKIFLIFVLTLPLDAALAFEVGFKIQTTYIILLVLMFFMLASRGFWYSKSPLDPAVFAFLVICSISTIQTITDPPPNISGVIELEETMRYRWAWYRTIIQIGLVYFFAIPYFFTVYICSKNKRNLDVVLKVYIVMAVIVALYGIYQPFAAYFNLPLESVVTALKTGGHGYGGLYSGSNINIYRSQSTFGEPLGFGHYLLTVLPLVLAFGVITKGYVDLRMKKWMNGAVLSLISVILFLALFLTRSRGAMVGLSVAIFSMIILLRKKYTPKLLLVLAIPIVFLIAFYSIYTKTLGLNEDILDMLRIGESDEEIDELYSGPMAKLMLPLTRIGFHPYSQRGNFYLNLIPHLLSKHPILGVGIGNFSAHASALLGKQDKFISPTGLWGNVLAETGILGFGVFCWLIISYYRIMIRTLSKVKGTYWSPYIIGFIACFTGFMVQFISWGSRMNIPTWFFIGISMSAVNLINREIQEANADASHPNEEVDQ